MSLDIRLSASPSNSRQQRPAVHRVGEPRTDATVSVPASRPANEAANDSRGERVAIEARRELAKNALIEIVRLRHAAVSAERRESLEDLEAKALAEVDELGDLLCG